MAPSPSIDRLVGAIQERFSDSLDSVLFYGAGLRDGDVDEEGLFDFIVVVDSYRKAYGGLKLALLNVLLPPNVFYLEVPREDASPLRAKYAVVSKPQLRRWVAPSCRQVWFWGRLAQPVRIAWSRDERAQQDAVSMLEQSVRTFADKAIPLVDSPFSSAEFWTTGLRASYGAELRAEKKGRSRTIYDKDPGRYERLTEAVAFDRGWAPTAEERFAVEIGGLRRWWHRRGWQLRRWQGKTLHVFRLVNGAATFKGGVDYLLWKIELHSGVKIEVSDRARRHPLLAGWVTFWKLRRKGGFR